MKVFTTDKIRNVVVLGHSGAGKTSLVSAMSNIATGTKVRTTEPAATTQTVVQPILWEDHKINILDAPGSYGGNRRGCWRSRCSNYCNIW